MEDGWRQTRKGAKRGSGGEAYTCVRMRHTMGGTEEEASVSSGESVDSPPRIGEAESAGSEAERRRAACAWTRSERALEGE